MCNTKILPNRLRNLPKKVKNYLNVLKFSQSGEISPSLDTLVRVIVDLAQFELGQCILGDMFLTIFSFDLRNLHRRRSQLPGIGVPIFSKFVRRQRMTSFRWCQILNSKILKMGAHHLNMFYS